MEKQVWSDRKVAVVGVGTTKQGLFPGATPFQLAIGALKDAMDEAGLKKESIAGLIGSRQFDGSGVNTIEFSKILGINPRVTGALDYPGSGFTLQYGAMLIASGVCDVVACVFGKNPAGSMTQLSGAIVYDADHGYFNAGGTAALGWSQHMATYGTTEEALGHVCGHL
jgi:acetyl-CoA acetyltransferase